MHLSAVIPGEVVDLLEVLEAAKYVRLEVRSCPHEVKVIAVWVNLKTQTEKVTWVNKLDLNISSACTKGLLHV